MKCESNTEFILVQMRERICWWPSLLAFSRARCNAKTAQCILVICLSYLCLHCGYMQPSSDDKPWPVVRIHNGVKYHLSPLRGGYVAEGIASWYGPGLHGRKTANGERFDQYALTAAHPSLPMSSWVEVTNVDNGRKVIVRINDRGPFKGNRLIDLSYTAAKQLDMISRGLTKVRVRALLARVTPGDAP